MFVAIQQQRKLTLILNLRPSPLPLYSSHCYLLNRLPLFPFLSGEITIFSRRLVNAHHCPKTIQQTVLQRNANRRRETLETKETQSWKIIVETWLSLIVHTQFEGKRGNPEGK